MYKKFKSISVRLAFRFTLVLTIAILALSLAFVWIIQSLIRSKQNMELMNSADVIERILIKLESKKDGTLLHNRSGRTDFPFSLKKEIPYYITYVVSDFAGNMLKTNDNLLPILSDTNGEVKRFFKENYFIDGNLDIQYFTKKIEINDKVLFIQTARDYERDELSKIVPTVPKSILLVILPILLVSFLISLLITKNTMNPVIRITKAASKISSSNLGSRLVSSGAGDEIDKLIETFNSLFERLKYDFDRERQFTSDVSHELKTPLAVILGQINLLLRWGKDDKNQLEKSLVSIKKESKSMEAIISNLLQISRLENGKIKPNIESVDLYEMFVRLQEEFKSVAQNMKISIFDSKFSIITDAELLHQVLTVVISNSQKYAGEDCEIKLSARKDAENVEIIIEDNGKGFAENVLPHVFERFYRGDEAHTRSFGGSGLGLSIAKVIVETLGGSIRAENSGTHGARIRILFFQN